MKMVWECDYVGYQREFACEKVINGTYVCAREGGALVSAVFIVCYTERCQSSELDVLVEMDVHVCCGFSLHKERRDFAIKRNGVCDRQECDGCAKCTDGLAADWEGRCVIRLQHKRKLETLVGASPRD